MGAMATHPIGPVTGMLTPVTVTPQTTALVMEKEQVAVMKGDQTTGANPTEVLNPVVRVMKQESRS